MPSGSIRTPSPFLGAVVPLQAAILLLTTLIHPAAAGDLAVRLPALPPVTQVKSAVATAPLLKLNVEGKAEGRTITFSKLLPDTAYDVSVVLTDGTVLQGVNMNWYDEEPARNDAGDLGDDDREQIRAIVQDVPGFYNQRDILVLHGNHDRAVGLLRLVRDKGFVNDKGGEVIWRIELWYFKYQNGGWEAVQQQNKVLRRERFPNPDARKAAEGPIRWVPALGGIRVGKGEPVKTVTLEEGAEAGGDVKAGR